MLDVTQARRVYYSTIASIPMLESQIKASVNALAVLTAQNPQQLTGLVSSSSEMPGCIQIISTGLPLDLLTRRPDIAAAREQIDAAAASVGISKKNTCRLYESMAQSVLRPTTPETFSANKASHIPSRQPYLGQYLTGWGANMHWPMHANSCSRP